MMLDVHKKIRIVTGPVYQGTAVRISVRFQEGSATSEIKGETDVILHGCGNVMAAFKRALDDLESQISGQFDAGEIADITNQFLQQAVKLGYRPKEAC